MSPGPPSGITSFLFTDVVGSTRLWEHAAGMGASLAVHDEILRDAIESNDGYVFSTAGDAFAAAFPDATSAIEAAVQVQLRLQSTAWPGPAIGVRMGVHTGTAEERGGDYFGPVLNRAARLMSAGHASQILISGATAELLSGELEVSLNDRGRHRLKDLDRPEHIFEVRHQQLPHVTQPLKTSDVRRTNLPEAVDSFIGRTEQIDVVAELMRDHRIVTLTGIGGTGKTRLAKEVGAGVLDRYDDGVWIVEMASITDPAMVMSAVADAWNLRAGEAGDLTSAVVRHLARKKILIIMDNCEHVIESAAHVVSVLTSTSPGLSVVATSRIPLGVSGEVVHPVPALHADDADSEAVQLFLDRVARVRHAFEADEDTMTAIAALCRRIDGIPLGIELAAARTRSMTPSELDERLARSFDLLRSRNMPSRHATLNATIEWSYQMLDPEAQAVFRRLSVMAGGFDLESAEALCEVDGPEAWEVLELVDELVDKSLVVSDVKAASATRFRMLEPIRQYGNALLEELGEAVDVEALHARHFAGLVRQAGPGLRGRNHREWVDRLNVEYDNVRAALKHLLESDLETHLRMCWDLTFYWGGAGLHLEGLDFLLAALESSRPLDPLTEIKGWYATTILAFDITLQAGVQYGRRCLALAEELDDDYAIGRAQVIAAIAMMTVNEDVEHALDMAVAGYERMRSVDSADPWWSDPRWDDAMHLMWKTAFFPGETIDRQAVMQSAIDEFDGIGDAIGVALAGSLTPYLYGAADENWIFEALSRSVEITRDLQARSILGHSQLHLSPRQRANGMFAEARRGALEAEEALRESGDVFCEIGAINAATLAALDAGMIEEASNDAERAVRAALLIDIPMSRVRLIDNLNRLAIERGDHEVAAKFHGRSMAWSFGGPRVAELAACRARLDGVFAAEELEALMAEGAKLSPDETLALFDDWRRTWR